MATIEIEFDKGNYYYIAFNGNRGYKYKNLEEAKNDIKELWGNWHDFKLLV